MNDLLRRGADWLQQQRTKHLAGEVIYQRGTASVTLPATIGRTVFETADEYGTIVRHEARDFLVLAADLILNHRVVLPERGDRIREQQGNRIFIHEVMAPGKEPAWRYSDPFRTTLRIHTKAIDVETT